MTKNNEHKNLNVPALRFPEFSGEWKKCKVSDLLDFYSTNSLSWEQLEYDTNAMMNLHYGLIHVGLPTMVDLAKDKLPNIKEDNMPTNFELCKEGDVAFADASEDTNEVAKTIEFYNLAEKNVVCGLHTIHGRDNKHKTVVGFKGYTFSSTVFHNQIRRIAQGTKIYSISTKNFSECYIGLPSKPEQTKIATLLRLIDERVATQNKIIEKLESLIKGIADKLFQTARETKLLLELAPNITSGTDKNGSGTIPLYGSTGIIGKVKNASQKGNIVLVARVGTIGTVQYVKESCGVSDNALIVEAGEMTKYIYHFLKTYKFAHITSGTTQPLITASSLKKIAVPTYDIERQTQIVLCLNILERKLDIEKQYLSDIAMMKQYLLHQMFI
ncbi:restriction endonuclease subunit S [Butyricimonas virosa]|uniref:restriction endonuclease subunit S n=2 Tax=Butyricimonas virosa TaxID=544645 RepID=UPI0024BAECE8|nr:restriction endonuclease subunit S [Butyricimonas virosa]